MRIVATLVTHNGGEMLGPLLAHHLAQGVSAFLVVDHDSTDDTWAIASACPAVVHIERDFRPGHFQGERVTRLARLACRYEPDWVIHLDDDELWTGLDRLAEVEPEVNVLTIAAIYNHLMVPGSPQRAFRPGDMPDYIAEPRQTCPRAIHRPDRGAVLGDGNHWVRLARAAQMAVAPPGLLIHHYPVRDYASFERKVANAAIALAARDATGETGPEYSPRWRRWVALLREGTLRAYYDLELASAAARLAAATVLGDGAEVAMNESDRVIRGFQIGRLGEPERLSIASFLHHGHDYELWSYELEPSQPGDTWLRHGAQIVRRPFPGGTRVRPAAEIVPESFYRACFPHPPSPSSLGERRRMAKFANYFRYRLMHALGGWWCDLDAIALRPFSTPAPFVFCAHPPPATPGRLINGVFKAEAGAPFLKALADALEPQVAAGYVSNPDPRVNTQEFTAAVAAHDLLDYTLGRPAFVPFAPVHAERAYYQAPPPWVPPWAWAAHLYKSMNHDLTAAPGSLYDLLADRYLRANVAYEVIPGHFDFQAIYSQAVAEARPGDALVEVGAWEGRSTAYMARAVALANKGLSFTTVDTWAGSPGSHTERTVAHRGGPDAMHALFLENLRRAGLADRVIVLRRESVTAAAGFPADRLAFVYLDADHSEAGLAADLAAWYPRVRPGGVIAGHNLERNFPGVRAAVTAFFAARGVTWVERGISWWARKPDPLAPALVAGPEGPTRPPEMGATLVEVTPAAYHRRFAHRYEYERVRDLFPRLEGIHAVVPHRFRDRDNVMIASRFAGMRTLAALARDGPFDPDLRARLRHFMIDFVVALNGRGLAHRDLHAGNLLVAVDQLYVVDWEFLAANPVPLPEAYDLTGQGLPSPRYTGRHHLFRGGQGCPSVASILAIAPVDFVS